jgi:ATP-dependent DNA ligase
VQELDQGAEADSRCFEDEAIVCALDLLKLDSDDLRRQPFADRKAKLRKLAWF